MKTFSKVFWMLFAMLLIAGTVATAATEIEGDVKSVDYTRKMFHICPVDESCGVTEENIFVILPKTTYEGYRRFRDVKMGDHVVVVGEQLNDVVWKARRILRK